MKTPPICQRNGYAHNARCRYTTGFYCEDCGEFFPKDSPTYLRYELPGDLMMVVHNIGADHALAKLPYPPEIDPLVSALLAVSNIDDEAKREAILNEALRFIAAHGKTPDSAVLVLKP